MMLMLALHHSQRIQVILSLPAAVEVQSCPPPPGNPHTNLRLNRFRLLFRNSSGAVCCLVRLSSAARPFIVAFDLFIFCGRYLAGVLPETGAYTRIHSVAVCDNAEYDSHLKPHTSHLTPHTSHLTPHTSHLTPHTSHLTPHTSHLIPHTSHLTPLTSYLTPHTSHLTPHTSHLTPHTSHLTPHTSHLIPHTSHLTPHTSHLTPHTSHLTPHTSHLTHSPLSEHPSSYAVIPPQIFSRARAGDFPRAEFTW
jgi:hypothetical protein